MIALLLIAATVTQGQVIEWEINQEQIGRRTVVLLERYYTYTRPDSLRLRYLRSNTESQPIRVRGRVAGPDSISALLSLSIGQLLLYPTDNLRIALGEELYAELLVSHRGAERTTVIEGDGNGHGDWEMDRWAIIALDRIDIRPWPRLGLFVMAGAPESNLSFWNDGSLRIGVVSPQWDLAAIAPLGVGATPVGPFRERRLLPVIGAAATVRFGGLSARVRVSSPRTQDRQAEDSTVLRFAHTLGSSAVWTGFMPTDLGILRWDLGVAVEEYTPYTTGGADNAMRIRRLSPSLDLRLVDYAGDLEGRIGTYDLALRASFTARLSANLWVEIRATSTDILRDAETFEHPFALFITPRIKF